MSPHGVSMLGKALPKNLSPANNSGGARNSIISDVLVWVYHHSLLV